LGTEQQNMSTTLVGRDRVWKVVLAVLGVLALTACASKPVAVQTGFLNDYSNLREESPSRMRFVSPRLREYDAFMIDPIEIRIPGNRLSEPDRAEAARYFLASLIHAVQNQGLTVTDTPGQGVARVQVALTDVAESTWWKKLHPGMRISGAGTGGAAMEGEVVDSVTGEQIAATVQSVSGSQWDFTAFSTLADVKGAIDKWTAEAAARLKQERAQAG
jgi:hypothetical protein